MYNTFIMFIKLLFNLHVREYYSDVKIATLSQVSFTMSLKKNLEKIATSVSKHHLSAAKQKDTLRNRGRSIRPSFIFKKITHAFYSKEPVDKSEKRIVKETTVSKRAITWRTAGSTGNKVHCFEVPLEERRCSLSSVPLTSIVGTVKEILTHFPST